MHPSFNPRRKRALWRVVERLEDRVLFTNWYVSSTGGLDANPGSLQQPFATIQQGANVAQPGDAVLIEAGVYHETITPANSGTAGASITYEPYDGQAVTIDGADTITGWTQYKGNIYQAPQNWNLGDGNNQVFAGTQMLHEASWPNIGMDPMNITTATIASTNAAAATQDTQTSATIHNSALNQAAGYWVGATVHLMPGQQWIWQTGTVTASAPGSITYSYTQLTPSEVPKAGNAFYLTGKFSQLNVAGEFYLDSTTNTLYAWMPNSNAPVDVESKARQYAFDLSGLAYINIQGLSLHAASINTNANSNNLELQSLNVSYVSQQMDNAYPWGAKYAGGSTGLLINGTNITVNNCTITYSSGNGIFLGGSNNEVENCTISEVDYAAGDEAAINIRGTADTASRNLVFDTGRSAITFYFAAQSQILNNVIHDVGLRTSDAGGVYAWHTDGMGTQIAYNIIYNLYGGGYGNSGILLDANDSDIIIDHNVIYHADSALKMNGTSTNDLVYNNTLLDNPAPPKFPVPLLNAPAALIEGAAPTMPQSQIINDIMIGSVMFSSGVMQSNNLTTLSAADFVDPTTNNYQLQAASMAIDKGSVQAPYTNAYTGTAPDIGAYEYGVPAFMAGPAAPAQIVVTAPSGQKTSAGMMTTFQLGSFTATGAIAPFTVTVDWGDGTPDSIIPVSASGPIPQTTHAYASQGAFDATITVVDSAANISNAAGFSIAVSAPILVPTMLAFGQQPSGALIGTTITPPPTVLVQAANGQTLADNTMVSLAIASGPAGATLGGTTTAAVQNGVATFRNLSISTPGVYTLTATAAALSSTTSAAFSIAAPIISTSISVATSNADAIQNQSVSLTATVAPSSAGASAPTGAVSFYDGRTLLGTANLGSDLTATLVTSALAPGMHSITASYSGDGVYGPSVSVAITQTIEALPPNTPLLVPSVGNTMLPGTIVEGVKVKANVPVLITNQGDGVKSEKFHITLFADANPTIDATAVPITSVSRMAKLKIGGTRSFPVRFSYFPATLGNGNYYLIVQVSDQSGFTMTTTLPAALNFQSPVIHLSATVGPITPGSIAANKAGIIEITVLNTGNIPATGRATISLGLSTDGQTVVAALLTQKRNLRIKPNVPLVLRMRFVNRSTIAAGVYFPTISIIQNGQVASIIGMNFVTLL